MLINRWQDLHRIEYSDNYHCEHFAIDCYRFLTNQDVSELILTKTPSSSPLSRGEFKAKNLRNFVKLDKPKQYCFVLMRDTDRSHVGIWYDNQVLHLSLKGVVMQPLFTLEKSFKKIFFYGVNQNALNQKTD